MGNENQRPQSEERASEPPTVDHVAPDSDQPRGETSETAAPEAAPPSSSEQPPATNGAYVFRWIREPFDEQQFEKALSEHLAALAESHGVENYTVLYLMDAENELSSNHSNRIYYAASAAKKQKPILLLVNNLGGSVESGYLISKTCKRLASSKFVVAIPRKAKSAATLLALGADEIHMGLMSELGPIDPQFGGLPALGMKNALQILSELACQYPGASTMLSEYIQAKLDLRILGYFERVNESAMQYAERLLAGKALPAGKTPRSVADQLVNHYKDHGFVIDFDEARDLLGDAIVREDTAEYAFSNAVFHSLDIIRLILDVVLSKDVEIVGALNGIRVFNRKGRS